AGHHCFRARGEWRSGRSGERQCNPLSQCDHHERSATPIAGSVQLSPLRYCRRPHRLWPRSADSVSPRSRLCGSHPQGREAGRPSGAGADQVRPGDQPEDRQGTWAQCASHSACPRRRGDRVKRREFITLLGGAAATWPLTARAQPSARRAKIGILYPGVASSMPSRMAAVGDALQPIGYREPDNVEFVVRSTGGDPARIIPLAMELVERKVDVILAASFPAVNAARSATTTTPIVAIDLESDPVNSGLIGGFSRPGGQVTGIFFDFPEFSKKWLQLLKEAMPKLGSIAVLWDPATGPVQIKGVEIAAKELNVKVEIMDVPGISNLDD